MNISDRYQRLASLESAEDLLASAAADQRRRADLPTSAPYVPPEGDVQEGIAATWREILGVDLVGIDDTFFELSGDSLAVVQVLVRLREAYDVDISIETFFEGPSVRQLAALVTESARSDEDGAGGDDARGDVLAELERIEADIRDGH